MPLTIYDTNGNPVWDTDSIAGGILADVRTFAATSTAVLNYPAFAGRAVKIIPMTINISTTTSNSGVVADTTQGWPRVTVSAGSAPRRFGVMVI